MRILQVINSLNTGGAEKLLLETIPLFIEKGIEMDLLVLNGTDYPFMKQLKQLNCCKIYSLGFKSVYNPINIFKVIPYLTKYDLVHVHLFPAQYWVVIAKIISFSKVKLIFTEHSTSNRRMQNKILAYFDKQLYSYYEKIICITNEVKHAMEIYLCDSKAVFVVIENGVNLKKITNVTALDKNKINFRIGEFDPLLIQVAAFRHEKDHKTLIRAMQYLQAEVKLLLVGEGVFQDECMNLVKELQLQERVFFLGVRMDVPQLLKSADICILSSNWEGFGLVAVEGMAAGKPFIASDVPGLSNVVKGAGVLFEKGNFKELAMKIKKLLADEKYYSEVVEACKERSKRFDIQLMIEKHIELYSSIV